MIRSGLVQYHQDLEPLMRDIDTVQQHPDNYNNGDLDALSESLEVNGMYRPIYVQESTGYIVAGNHTWQACKQLGATRIPMVLLDCDNTTAKRIMIADNRIAALAMPDHAQLLTLLEGLNEHDSLPGTGYREHDLEVLRHLAEIPVEHDEYGQWPTLTFKVHPKVRTAFYKMTQAAGDDRERFELMLRLAGWDGK